MENHPIPQDVTGFQFKLVGSMTIKQFGYVGAGVILSVIFFYSPLAWYLKFVLVPLFALIGISFAFLPIGGRPLDLMTGYFLNALIKPNQYVYQKVGGSLSFMELNLQPLAPKATSAKTTSTQIDPKLIKKEEQLLSYLYNTTTEPNSPIDKREDQFVAQLFSQPAAIPQSPMPAAIPNNAGLNQPNPAPTAHVEPMPHAQALNTNLQTPQSSTISESAIPPAPQASPTPLNPTTQSAAPSSQLPQEQLEHTTQPTIVQIAPDTSTVSQQASGQSGSVISGDFPNLINGIVKDSRGNVLPGILVEVLNKDQESVRAFKTNALGQFASATQLSNGVYTLAFEDPKNQHRFTSVQIEANGSTIAPLTILSVDAREELRRSLFG